MRRVCLKVSLLALASLSALCGRPCPASTAKAAESESVVSRREKGFIDWTQDYVEATGMARMFWKAGANYYEDVH